MTFQRYSRDSGIILVDILLALSLGAFFVIILAESSVAARSLYEGAHDKEQAIGAYESGAYETSVRPYGNEMKETDMISGLEFNSVARNIYASLAAAAGTPLCSADLLNRDVVGSFRFQNALSASTSDPSSSSDPSPIQIEPKTLPVDPLLPLTDLTVRNGVVYVSADSTTASDADLIIADIRPTADPTVISSLNTGPGLVKISMAGRRIYAAAASTAAQLHIIRLDGLASPVLEKKYRLPPPYATATPPLGSAIFYEGGRVYLGTEKWDGDEFDIVSVADPANPIKLGGLEIGGKVNDIYVKDGLAYIAAAVERQLIVIDVIDPTNPFIVGYFSPSGWQRQEGKTVSLFENSLQFGRTSGGYNISQDHESFYWATATPPISTGPDSADVPGGVYGAIADKSHVFLATREANKEFQIMDRSMQALSSQAHSLPVAPQSLTCDNDRLYVLAHTAPVIYEITGP